MNATVKLEKAIHNNSSQQIQRQAAYQSRNIEQRNRIENDNYSPVQLLNSLLLQRKNSSLERTMLIPNIEGTQCLNPLSQMEDLQLKGQYLAHRDYQLDLIKEQYSLERVEKEQQIHIEAKLRNQSRLEHDNRIGSSQLKNTTEVLNSAEGGLRSLENKQELDEEKGDVVYDPFPQPFKQLQPKEIQFDEKAVVGRLQKKAFPPRELPVNQRINQLMYLSKEQFLQKLQTSYLGQTFDEDDKKQTNPYLVTVTKDFFKQPLQMQQEMAAHPTNFNFDHRQFIPKTTFFSTKKEKKSPYQINLQEQKGRQIQDEFLKINSFQMKHRYKLFETQSPLSGQDYAGNPEEKVSPRVQIFSKQANDLQYDDAIMPDIENKRSLKESVRASVMQLEETLADTQKRVVLVQKGSILSDKTHKSKIGESNVSNKLYISVKQQEKAHLNSSINTQHEIKSDKDRSRTELRHHQKLASDLLETFAPQSLRDSLDRDFYQEQQQLISKTLESDVLPTNNSINMIINDEQNHLLLKEQRKSRQKRNIMSMMSYAGEGGKLGDDEKRIQSQKEINNNQNYNEPPVLFFQTELSGRAEGSKALPTHHQSLSPLRNSVVSQALIQDLNKSTRKSVIQKPQVDYSEVKVYSKVVKEELIFENKAKSIFQAGDTNNCKDFLNTYFQSKEPKSFDNFKKKYQMQNVRTAIAKQERDKLNGVPRKYKESFVTPPSQQLL